MKRYKSNNNSEVAVIKKDVEKLTQTVFHGNGSPSVINQITKLDGRLNHLETIQEERFDNLQNEMDLKFANITEIVTEKFKNLSNLIESEFKTRGVKIDKAWNHRTAIITSLIASGTSILVIFVSEFLKRLH